MHVREYPAVSGSILPGNLCNDGDDADARALSPTSSTIVMQGCFGLPSCIICQPVLLVYNCIQSASLPDLLNCSRRGAYTCIVHCPHLSPKATVGSVETHDVTHVALTPLHLLTVLPVVVAEAVPHVEIMFHLSTATPAVLCLIELVLVKFLMVFLMLLSCAVCSP